MKKKGIMIMQAYFWLLGQTIKKRQDDMGSIRKQQEVTYAILEYDEFNKHQHILSDFDKELKKLTKK